MLGQGECDREVGGEREIKEEKGGGYITEKLERIRGRDYV